MANPVNNDTFYQNPTNAQWVNRDGETIDLAAILGAAIKSGSVFGTLTIGTSATQIKVGGSDLSKRHTMIVHNDSGNTIYVGFDNTVTTSNGLPIENGDERSFFFDPNDGLSLHGIAGSSSIVRVFEIK